MIAPDIPDAAETVRRFYRPELDALRFFAFLAVLIHHGPHPGGFFGLLSQAGGFGLSMFFLLSAYLITELLLREREQTGTVAWSAFFKRRALRIWPLYYAALVVAVMIALIPPHAFWTTRQGIVGLIFFVANGFGLPSQLGRLLNPLWSISIEEQFYLVWPPIIRAGGRKFALIAVVVFTVSAVAWLTAFSGKGWWLWYDTPVQFLFFAAGALIAIATHNKPPIRMRSVMRAGLLVAGIFSLLVAALTGVGTAGVQNLSVFELFAGYGEAVAGCVLVFFSVFGISSFPRPVIYLGKISYGLYVFHAGLLDLSRGLTVFVPLAPSSVSYMLMVDGVALLLCALAAHLSYQYLEMPFLRLKQRYEVVKSRPA